MITSDQSRKDNPFDLEERTAKFGEAVIQFLRGIPKDPITIPLISQLVRSATSIGANYCEADDAVSRKVFKLKVGTCKSEARETKHWLRMIGVAHPPCLEDARNLWKEAKQLHLIFCKIYRA